MTPRTFLLVGGVAFAAALAGCVGPTGPPVSSRTVPLTAPSVGGTGDYALGIQVTDEPGGPPLPHAAVVVYYSSASPSTGGTHGPQAIGSGQASGSGGPDGGQASVSFVVNPSSQPSTPQADTTIPLRTDENGVAVAKVPANRVVGIVASADGFTEEWVAAVAAGARGANDTIAFPLYHSQLSWMKSGAWSPAAVSPGKITKDHYAWNPDPVVFGKTDAAHAGYLARLSSLSAGVTWVNGAGGEGDLAIGVGANSNSPDIVGDRNNDVTPGTHMENVSADPTVIGKDGWRTSPGLYAGPATASAFVAPFGMGYATNVTATFDPRAAEEYNAAAASTYSASYARASPLAPGANDLAIIAAAAALACLALRRTR
ncbi:MAG: hypothetical protein ACYDDF_12555 [Thermoplasmatota archaeon]